VGRLPYLGAVAHTGPSRRDGQHNSAQRLANVWGAFDAAGIGAAVAEEYAGRALLLLDDVTDSGWTLTTVTRTLRRAGAGRVFPFVLGVAQ
jgi:ATP-dependent DNA helicase RecQ